MRTLCCLISHAVAELCSLLLARLDPSAPLQAEIERMKHELNAERQRGDYWSERTGKLLLEACYADNRIRRLNLQNAKLMSALGNGPATDPNDIYVNMWAMERMAP